MFKTTTIADTQTANLLYAFKMLQNKLKEIKSITSTELETLYKNIDGEFSLLKEEIETLNHRIKAFTLKEQGVSVNTNISGKQVDPGAQIDIYQKIFDATETIVKSIKERNNKEKNSDFLKLENEIKKTQKDLFEKMSQISQLSSNNEQLAKENKKLTEENERLVQENQRLSKLLGQNKPVEIKYSFLSSTNQVSVNGLKVEEKPKTSQDNLTTIENKKSDLLEKLGVKIYVIVLFEQEKPSYIKYVLMSGLDENAKEQINKQAKERGIDIRYNMLNSNYTSQIKNIIKNSLITVKDFVTDNIFQLCISNCPDERFGISNEIYSLVMENFSTNANNTVILASRSRKLQQLLTYGELYYEISAIDGDPKNIEAEIKKICEKVQPNSRQERQQSSSPYTLKNF